MSDPIQMRNVLNALLPEGRAHAPVVPGNPLDEFYEALAAALQLDHNDFQTLVSIRNPYTTPILSDLEREYGIMPSAGQIIAQRQAILQYHKTARGLSGQWWVLQNAINAAGFTGVNVLPNDPAVNPAPFLGGTPQAWCGNATSCCGYFSSGAGGVVLITYTPSGSAYLLLGPGESPGTQPLFKSQGPANATVRTSGGFFSFSTFTVPTVAAYSQYILLGPGETPGSQPAFESQGPPNANYAKSGGVTTVTSVYTAVCSSPTNGQLVVNGRQYQNAGAVLGCGSGIWCHPVYAGQYNNNECGSFVYAIQLLSQFGPPQDPGRYPLVFFVGGSATYDAAGHLLTISNCNVPTARVQELATLILRYKPLHTWAALLMNAV
jgi:hypothetical protein